MSICFPCLPLYLTFLQGPFEHVISKSVVGCNDVNELKQAIERWVLPVVIFRIGRTALIVLRRPWSFDHLHAAPQA